MFPGIWDISYMLKALTTYVLPGLAAAGSAAQLEAAPVPHIPSSREGNLTAAPHFRDTLQGGMRTRGGGGGGPPSSPSIALLPWGHSGDTQSCGAVTHVPHPTPLPKAHNHPQEQQGWKTPLVGALVLFPPPSPSVEPHAHELG